MNTLEEKQEIEDFNPKEQIESSHRHYSDEKFWNKLMNYAKKAGEKTLYTSLLLYFTAQNPAVPKSAKLTIAGALGYLILPADIMPDFIPVVGLVDDASVIAYALYQVISHIDEPTKQLAHDKMKSWLGQSVDESNIDKELLPKI